MPTLLKLSGRRCSAASRATQHRTRIWQTITSRTELIRALSLLRPCDAEGLRKRRLGSRLDGGYVVADDLGSIGAAYSFGISVEVPFDQALADAGIPVRMFDTRWTVLPWPTRISASTSRAWASLSSVQHGVSDAA